ncbi:MAG: LysR family transcriptional regulator [Clostridiales bacterium]|nr:LysR family transcriptional regulator [Clostridiales bacterium]
MSNINLQTLRYISAVEQTGSISRAGQQLYVSHSTISRAIKELENEIGITLFQRTSKGAVATTAGLEFIRQARRLLMDMEQLENRYYERNQIVQNTLLVASQRYTAVTNAFMKYYKTYCQDSEYLNLALLEDTTDQIIRMVANHTCHIGVLHYTSDQEEAFFNRLNLMELQWHLLESSPIAIQIRKEHPLANEPFVTISMLEDYPHIVYVDEDITHINYCSDISHFSKSIYKKRIVVRDRGTMRQMVNNTEGYYIGCDASRFNYYSETEPVYVPIKDVEFRLNTVWVRHTHHFFTEAEKNFIDLLNDFLTSLPNQVS